MAHALPPPPRADKAKVILSNEQLTLLRLRGNKVDLENVGGGCEPLRDDQPRQGNLNNE